jgi:hypothetical protein
MIRFSAWVVIGAMIVVSIKSVEAQIDFVVQNNFDSGVVDAANYFGSNYSDSQVWLMFANSGGHISYTGSGGSVTVSDNTAIQLSSVHDRKFTVNVGANSTRVYAALTSSLTTSPFSGLAPDPFSVSPVSSYGYALAEFTYLGNSFDTTDTSYEDTFAYPTRLTTSTGGTAVNSSSWAAGTQAAQVVSALGGVMPSTATARVATTTTSSSPSADRYVGTSLHFQTGVDFSATPNATVSYSGPGYNAYLGFLQANTPSYTDPDNAGETINGYYLDYSGNGGYSGYLQVTGTDGNYGLTLSNVRINTGSGGGVNTNTATGRALGTAVTGTVVLAANGDLLTLDASPDYTFTGSWTDMVISSGNQLYTNVPPDIGAGPVVRGTGDFAPGGSENDLVSTLLATTSSILVTGLLGSDTFNATPSSNFWFGTGGIQPDTPLFSALWPGLAAGTVYWDPYVATLVGFNKWEGYSFPYQDRFAGLPHTALNLSSIDTITWELGLPVPEPSAIFLIGLGLVGLGVYRWRKQTEGVR